MSARRIVLLVLDESAAMQAIVADGTVSGGPGQPLHARVATAVNRFLGELADAGGVDVAVVGYRTDPTGRADVGCRWGGLLSGREFVAAEDLAAAGREEIRSRRVPAPSGGTREEQVAFRVWYEPGAGHGVPAGVWAFCRDLIASHRSMRGAESSPVFVLHVFASRSHDWPAEAAGFDPAGIRLFQCHLSPSSAAITTAFPSTSDSLVGLPARRLFDCCTPLSDAERRILQPFGAKTTAQTRALVLNGFGLHLGLMMKLLAEAAVDSGAASESASKNTSLRADTQSTQSEDLLYSEWIWSVDRGHKALIIFLVDQSEHSAAPITECGESIAACIAQSLNSWLWQLSISCATAEGYKDFFDIAIIGYGTDDSANPIIEPPLVGPLAGREIVTISEVAENPARIDTVTAFMPDEVTGEMLEMPQLVPIWIDPVTRGAAPMCHSLRKVCEIVDAWIPRHPDSVAPVLVHLTAGDCDDGDPRVCGQALTQRALTSRWPEERNALLVNCLYRANMAPVVLPGSSTCLPDTQARQLFELSSAVPSSWRRRLAHTGVSCDKDGRLFAINDGLLRLLCLYRLGS